MSSLATASHATSSIAARARVANSRALASTSAPVAAYNPAASSRRGARRATITRAEGTDVNLSGLPFVIARKAGFDTSEGLAGFTPFAELWVGRTAMGGGASLPVPTY
jgi:hypothetical protein